MSKKTKTIDELLGEAIVTDKEQPYPLPNNWVWVYAGDIMEFVGGGTPSKSNAAYWNGNIPWTTVKDIKKTYINSSIDHITSEGLKNSSASMATENELLLITRMSPGKSAITKMETAINQDLKIVRPKIKIPAYLLWLFFTVNTPLIDSLSTGSTVKGIQVAKLKKIPFPLAPLDEQKRIAEKVERLLGKIDEAKRLIEEAKETFELRRAAILDMAFRGELTKKWRSVNSNGDALQYIQVLKTTTNFKSSGMITEPYDLPSGWRWAKLGDLFHVQVGSTPSRKNSDYWNGEHPWISSGEVQFNKINESREKVTELAVKECRLKLAPKGSILFGMIGEGKTRGQVALLNMDAYHNQNVASIWVSSTKVSSLYVYYWLTSQYNKNRQNSAGNNQPAYNKSRVQELLIPIAPIAEMEEIESWVHKLLKLEIKVIEMLSLEDKVIKIKQSILAKAFRGELGTNDPSEESAIELLKEVLEEKSS